MPVSEGLHSWDSGFFVNFIFMAKKEVKTDLWVYELLNEADIHLTPQGCDILEINESLKTASKSGTGNVGYPEYCGVVKDFIIVIENCFGIIIINNFVYVYSVGGGVFVFLKNQFMV